MATATLIATRGASEAFGQILNRLCDAIPKSSAHGRTTFALEWLSPGNHVADLVAQAWNEICQTFPDETMDLAVTGLPNGRNVILHHPPRTND